VFDEDGNGVITKQELLKILKANHMASSDSEVIRKAETIMMQVRTGGTGCLRRAWPGVGGAGGAGQSWRLAAAYFRARWCWIGAQCATTYC
jgi:hypothetical protein